MAKERGDNYLKDPVGSRSIHNVMPSGLVHFADSLGSGREGRLILKYGSPGNPEGGSTSESAEYAGTAPGLLNKFQKRGQR